MSTAGEALNPEVFRQFEKATGLQIMEGFGQSETTVALANLAGAIVIDKAFDHHIIKIIITQTSLEYSVLKTRADYPSFFWFVDIENCVIVYLIIICH